MALSSKRRSEINKKVDVAQSYQLEEAVAHLQACPPVKFDQTVEVALRLGVDPRKSDQQVRGTVALPHGTGKNIRVLVLTSGPKVDEALEAGAEFAGAAEYIEKIKGGWTDFDAVIATPDMMREVGKLGKVLGPRGLMPTPKAGTVTPNVAKAVKEIKAGKIEFKLDRHGVINVGVGKLSFPIKDIIENIRALLGAVSKAKPAGAKGTYIKSFSLSSTMGPGMRIELREEAQA